MQVTLCYEESPRRAILYQKPATNVGLASGSLVINLADGSVEICELDRIGNLVITDRDEDVEQSTDFGAGQKGEL